MLDVSINKNLKNLILLICLKFLRLLRDHLIISKQLVNQTNIEKLTPYKTIHGTGAALFSNFWNPKILSPETLADTGIPEYSD